MTNIRMTSFDFEYRGYIFEANLRTASVGSGWTMIRRKTAAANIPPCKEILTIDGWKGICNDNTNASAPEVFRTVDGVVANIESMTNHELNEEFAA